VGAFKPSPRVYEHAATRLETPIGDLMLVSSNPFDVIGARRSGMEAAWLRRGAALFDELDVQPTLVVGGLPQLATLLEV
jgi:2-haloacid dehalogenase